MRTKSKLVTPVLRHIHLFILGSALTVSAAALFLIHKIGPSRVEAFGPTAQTYFSGIRSGLATATIILLVSFVAATFFDAYLKKIGTFLEIFYSSLTETKKNILILLVCVVFAFATHAGGLMNGYFVTDDFTVMNLNHSESFSKAVFTPYGDDHVFPLFRAEFKAIDTAFGENPVPFNMFVFALFALTPFFVYLTFRRLGLGILPFLLFLTIYSGATSWADLLTGYYAMSMYVQILFFFSAAMWSYVAWSQSKKTMHLFYLGAATFLALAIDIPGIWVVPSIFFLMLAVGWTLDAHARWSVAHFLKENTPALVTIAAIGICFAAFWVFSFTVIQPGTFLSTLNADGGTLSSTQSTAKQASDWRPIPLAENFVAFFSSGVSLPVIAPNVVKILSHPALDHKLDSAWAIFELALFVFNLWFFWFVFKRAPEKERKLITWFAIGMIGTILMAIIARPNHNPIPDFDYRYAGAPFFFYACFLAVAASLLLRSKKAYAVTVVLAFMIVSLAVQQAFSFRASLLNIEAQERTVAITQFKNSLLAAIAGLAPSEKNLPLVVPNLLGGHIFQKMSGISLADYVVFFDPHLPIQLIRNEAISADVASNIAVLVSSLRSSTSPEFKAALATPGTAIRSYYASPSWMTATPDISSVSYSEISTRGDRIIRGATFDPEKFHMLDFFVAIEDVPGNLEFGISFKNDFGIPGEIGTIRIDDYTPYIIKDTKRIYHLQTDLLQLIPFALSKEISNVILSVPSAKNAAIGAEKIF